MLKVICSASDKHSCNIKLKGLNPLLDLKMNAELPIYRQFRKNLYAI